MPLATLGKQLAGTDSDSGMFSGSFQEALLSRPLLPLLLFTPTLGEMSRGARQELGTPGSLEKEACASQRSDDVQFPGASVGTPGHSGRQTVFVLPNKRLSVSLLLSGNNVCADEVDSVMECCQGPGSPPSLLFPTLGMLSGYSYFIIFGKYPKEKNKNIYLHTQR